MRVNFALGIPTVLLLLAAAFSAVVALAFLNVDFGEMTPLTLIAIAIISTDGWQRRLKRNWKRLNLLVYPAAVLGLGIVDIPIRYLARTYGETNIQRFRHGVLLLKMTWIGLFRIKLGVRRKSRAGRN